MILKYFKVCLGVGNYWNKIFRTKSQVVVSNILWVLLVCHAFYKKLAYLELLQDGNYVLNINYISVLK